MGSAPPATLRLSTGIIAAFSNGVTAPQSILRQRSVCDPPIAANLPDVRVRSLGRRRPGAKLFVMAIRDRTGRGRGARHRRGIRPAALFAAAVVVMVAAQLLRQPGARTWNTVWAEDGAVYATDAYAHPALSTLLRGYAGYVQFVPRLIALGVRPIPVSWIAPYFAVMTAVVTAVLALFVYRSTDGWVQSLWLRASVMFMTALVPIIYFEVNANIANLGWPLLFASFWAFASYREDVWDVVMRSVIVALTALSTPLLALLLPAALALAALRRRRADVIVVLTSVAALVVQWFATQVASSGPNEAASWRDVPLAYGVRVVGSLVFGERWLDRLWIKLGVGLAVTAVVVAIAVVVVAAPRRIDPDRLWFAAVSLVLSMVLFTVPVWIRGTDVIRLTSGVFTGVGSRYVYLPLLVLFSGFIVLIDGTTRRPLVGLLAAQSITLMIICLGLSSLRSPGPTWSAALAEARGRCRAPNPPAVVQIPITPKDQGWVVTVSCARLGDVSSAR
jgi:hypothetical protein